MAVSTSSLLSLNLLLLLAGFTCLGVGIYLVSSPTAAPSAAASTPSSSARPASESGAPSPARPLSTERPDTKASTSTTERHGEMGVAGDSAEHMKTRGPEMESNEHDDTNRMIASGTALSPCALPRRSVGGGVVLLVLAACLLAFALALVIAVVRRGAAGPVAKLPVEGGHGGAGVAVIEPRGPAAQQEKSDLPPAYGADSSWDTPSPEENPYYAAVSFGVPPPAYSDVCGNKSP